MNKAQKRPTMTKVLSMILALIMVLSLLPLSGFTAEPQAADTSTFMRIFHLDCGRKYFTVGQINDLIDAAAANNYTHVELAFGNDGLRFLLDDMSVDNYAKETVSKAIHSANEAYCDFDTDELTQSDMDAIISHAKEQGIGIIPMIDVPAHTNALVTAMQSLGVSVDGSNTNTNSEGFTTKAFSVSNTETVSFVKAFVQKYVDYFASKDCKYFNLGADECGYGTTYDYSSLANMIGALSDYIKAKKMTAMMFNDGFRTDNTLLNALKSRADDIIICYWTYSKYSTPNDLAEAGFRIINTHNKWYYVAGNENDGWLGYKWALNNINGDYSDCTVVDNAKNQTYKTDTGCMLAFWCDNPSNAVNYENVKAYIKALADKNPTVFVASSTDVDPTPTVSPEPTETPANIPITVTAGSTATAEIKGYNYSGKDYTTEDPSIATVESVTGEDAHEGTVKYESANGVTYGEIATNTSWTKTDYYYKVGNNYYPVYAKYETDGWGTYYYYYYGYSTTDTASDVIQISYSWWSGSTVGGLYTKTGTETVKAYTKITFKGLTAGKTTYVTIGHVRYTINVIAEKVDGITMPIQLWFTNSAIETEDGIQTSNNFSTGATWLANHKPYYVSVKASDAYGKDGVPLTSVLPNNLLRYEEGITYWINAKTGKTQKELVLLSGRVHSSSDGNIQKIYSNDYSNSGTEFTYVRYWGGKWAVTSTPDVASSWTYITDTSATTNSPTSSGVQLAAYYMMRSEITKEVTTDVSDWGFVNGEKDYNVQIGKGNYVMLDFSVKYENGTRNPSKFPQNGKTFVFHCNSSDKNGAVASDSSGNYYRKLNNFRGVNSSDYEIYMVTVTMTSASASSTIGNTSSYSYDENTEQIVWAIDEATKTNSGLAEYESISGSSSVYSGCKIGGDPYVRGVEVYDKHGALITYYVRAKVTEDSLTVYYINQSTNERFYSYNIAVKSGTYFKNGIALPDIEKDYLKNSEVINIKDVEQKIPTNLQEMPLIPAEYRYAIYKCVAVTQDDGSECKNVYLYYTFSNNVSFVVDFGLPLNIPLNSLSTDLSQATINSVTVSGAKYGEASYDNRIIKYTPTKAINGSESLTVAVTGTLTYTDEYGKTQVTTGTVTYFVTIIPASNVYYEDSFAKFEDGTGTAAAAQWSIDDDKTAAKAKTTQALEALGSKENVYGYDSAYADSTKYSMGSAHKVTVSSDMADKWADGSAWPTATFTFKGTGFDIISLTDNTSGTIFVDVYKGDKAEGNTVKSYFVNNYYGYTQVTGDNGKVTWVVDKTSENSLYQIPVMKVTDLDYDTYTVVISVEYDSFFDLTDDNQYTFVLDAIRVYNPMDKDNETYVQDDEGYPQYIKLRDSLVDENTTTNAAAVFIDGSKAETSIKNYANYGPNNEVYLAKNQAISFNVPANANIASIQIGAKAPSGTAKMNVTGTANDQEISSATEMYYKVNVDATKADRQVTIANNGDGILSLTNLKITFTNKSSVALAALTDEDQANAVATVRALFAAPTPEVKTFAPKRFEPSWNSVRVGQKATLTVKTSADVEAITVNGETVDNYKTRYERSGWGWWAEKVEYRVFTYTVTATETMDYEVAAVNAEGTASEPVICTLTVKPAQTNWWDDIWNGFFGKWF